MQLGAGPGWAGPCQLEGACSSESAMAKQMDGRGGVTGALPDGGLLWLAVLKTWAGSALPPCPCRLQAGHTLLGCSGHCYWKQSLEDRCGWVMAGAWLGAACSGAGVLRVPRAGGGGPTTVSGLQLVAQLPGEFCLGHLQELWGWQCPGSFPKNVLSFPESPPASWAGAIADQGTCPEFMDWGINRMPAS